MAWRLNARFHTNNLIESYYHILKAYYLGRSKNFWVNRLVYMFSQVVEHDYRQEGLKIMYGFKKLVLTHVEKAKKKAFDVDHEDALCMIKTVEDNLVYKCRSFTDNSVWYELLLKEEVLSVGSCPDPNNLCKHIFLVGTIMGLQYSLTKELPIIQNPEVQIILNTSVVSKQGAADMTNSYSLYVRADPGSDGVSLTIVTHIFDTRV
ncbi:hypothetical protein PHYBLDRAFT_161877 [Phycomyces blakesleeanus NRRL 1555(-)]|uniref:SWIM-type domain-containing protein n=1 Tax=Phycomyces blakesleeanus (strain ATCC 8743b / DSM 1359 / FGSC 10004 / NBRC 33097 / NRRL 1555) TaxID=763407 RepID=A0A167RB08_PHYB8|nr:hypothetical protein PHYBLDRAFT_161877 [Phycomyces blakesleeanus NRRL 1555(-)]OAD81258.1 hypothetical protein PHYBLDRAFT_161877 [Phycomyces blakesleeanus NRRL 1555(-)]|eukprot:XP_018299298.1 hypothetical protein PHYBLDRAFT_161877 [Phycomyces blakesleeanus NRRL 1555(-)]